MSVPSASHSVSSCLAGAAASVEAGRNSGLTRLPTTVVHFVAWQEVAIDTVQRPVAGESTARAAWPAAIFNRFGPTVKLDGEATTTGASSFAVMTTLMVGSDEATLCEDDSVVPP